MSRPIMITAITALVTLVAASSAFASPYGIWLRPSTGGKIQSFKCGGGIGLKVVQSKDKAKVGKTIMCGAKSTGANKYTGSIKNLEDGKTYAGKVQINGNTMSLSGCVLGGLICKTENWKRLK